MKSPSFLSAALGKQSARVADAARSLVLFGRRSDDKKRRDDDDQDPPRPNAIVTLFPRLGAMGPALA